MAVSKCIQARAAPELYERLLLYKLHNNLPTLAVAIQVLLEKALNQEEALENEAT